jgi:hypothetical protein
MKADAPGPSAEDEARVVSLLRADVEATIGPGHDGAIIEAAARRRPYAGVPAQYVCDVVDDVQQHFHDAFVDATWPACPHHPKPPLRFSDGWWRCERIEEPIARLGMLSGLNQDSQGRVFGLPDEAPALSDAGPRHSERTLADAPRQGRRSPSEMLAC